MPCRKENYIFLEQSVTVDSKEVDALVTKIGEALQLHNNNNHSSASQKTLSCLHGISANNGGVKQAGVNGNNAGAAFQKLNNNGGGGGGCCLRLRNRSHRSSRASPYHVPGSSDQEWDHIKPWNKKTRIEDEDDPHRLLQELILSGNLIKEAVRRLQFPAADCGDFTTTTTDSVSC
ncbi:hypothetical protein NHX12_001472 [Muraenolepis orangiensis]|uniref:GSK-3-binding protein n=1 Tax=Muraenolepis orangiensis TaxID=630683 RepID=A0A9Q0IEZ9_9TELE|nr:hypothetical protein NHX12_001472 [Muraenolepis orangiensis]